jgi:hypothetical protein
MASERARGGRYRVAGPVVLALMVTFLFSGVPARAAPPAPATFNPNLLLPNSAGVAEPSIRTNEQGIPFVIGPTGVPAGCKAFRVTHDGSSAKFIGFPDHTAGGGDCDWAIGPKETSPTISPPATAGDLAYSSLTLANITTGKSDDGGNTFGPPNPYSQQVAGDDRMWMAADPKLNNLGFTDIYMTYHDISVVDIQLGVSRDGGQTYVQNGPIINPTDVPPGQWQGGPNSPPGPAGNGLGNIVARRPNGGSLTLFSIFVTPDSAADNASQGLNGTGNFNRVYEAVGTVTDVPAPGTPVISWRNYEVYHGPIGARYDRIFPVTAVDSAGNVYAIWTDGNTIQYKTDATGTGWNPTTAPQQIPNPTGVNTTIMPWAQAGASGIADVVFYGAHGGSGAQPNPQDDPNNQWDVYMAQTIDGGGTWGVFKANDHTPIHTGPICIDGLGCDLSNPPRDRTLLDFFQVSIDPTNGAADIAYADDHASPGNAVVYFTRQCTGTSATTGLALTNDCVAPSPPPPPPQGTSCPGPQIVDFTGDAPNNYPGGDGANMDNLDIVNASFTTPDATHLQTTLTLKNLAAPPPPVNLVSGFWTVYWRFGNTIYYAQATSNGTGNNAVYVYSVGTYDGSFNGVDDSLTGSVSGVATPGSNGTFVITFPRSDVGNPANGATLTDTSADVHGSFTLANTGVYYTAPADRAPDSGFGADYVVAQVCKQPPPPTGTKDVTGGGTIAGKNGGTAKFGFTAKAKGGGNLTYQDDLADVAKFKAESISPPKVNGNTATWSGTGLWTHANGTQSTVAYMVTVVDNGSGGSTDSFSISFSSYSNGGTLRSGNITIH